jgi:hypothetical protein
MRVTRKLANARFRDDGRRIDAVRSDGDVIGKGRDDVL